MVGGFGGHVMVAEILVLVGYGGGDSNRSFDGSLEMQGKGLYVISGVINGSN